jgi:23S rRNA pseudouridine1911/1915/1917 synthase
MSTPPAPEVTGFVDVTFTVEPNYAGWRLDRYLCEKIRRLSRTRVQRILERSLVADRPLKPSTRVHPGLTFTLRRRTQAEPDVPEEIVELHLDQSLLVLDKPAGLPIHPTARYHHHTLVKLLERKHGPALRRPGAPARPRDLRAARCGRGAEASRALMRAFQSGEVHKEYLAVVEGNPRCLRRRRAHRRGHRPGAHCGPRRRPRRQARLHPLRGRAPLRPGRCSVALSVASPRPGASTRSASTPARPASRWWGQDLRPDPGYFDRFSKRCLEPEAWARLRLPRHALHAARLAFSHPTTGAGLRFESPLPPDLSDFCLAIPRSGEVGRQRRPRCRPPPESRRPPLAVMASRTRSSPQC